MARVSFVCFFVLSLIAISFVASSYAGGEGSVALKDCPRECARRCALSKAQESCPKYCNMCCQKCLCVPSGTSGHKEECPCYNNWKSSKGKPKCP